jgi:hypothetical protein
MSAAIDNLWNPKRIADNFSKKNSDQRKWFNNDEGVVHSNSAYPHARPLLLRETRSWNCKLRLGGGLAGDLQNPPPILKNGDAQNITAPI